MLVGVELSYPGVAMPPFVKMMRFLPSSFTPYSVWMHNQRSCLSAFQLHCFLGLNAGTTASFSDTASPKKGKRAPLQERKMVDRFRLHVTGGQGGSGCTSFRKSRHSRHGVADGGNGGKGGDVILICSGAIWDLSNLQHHLSGKKGGQGSSKRRVGSRGVDKVVQVPVGTVVHLVSGSVPSLEQPSVTPNTTLSKVENDGAGDRIDDAISASWLDSLCLDKRKGEQSGLLVNEREGFYQVENPGDEHSTMEIGSAGGKVLGLVSRTGIDEGRTFGEEDSSGLVAGDAYSKDENVVDEGIEHVVDVEEDERQQVEHTVSRKSAILEYSIAEFVTPGQSLVMASGGTGGRGNAAYARGFGRQKLLPSLEHENGSSGSEAVLVLELKTIADVGLVGAPNAGKSTLLGAISRAKPAVGHYAFTTLRPNIGKLEYEDSFSMTVADIPGLINGAHQNRGLGYAFLRHIERTKALAYVLDLSAGIGDKKGPLPWDQLDELRFELEKYEAGLSTRPALVVANKIDEPGTDLALAELRQRVASTIPIYPVCAVLEEGTKELREGLRELVDAQRIVIPKP